MQFPAERPNDEFPSPRYRISPAFRPLIHKSCFSFAFVHRSQVLYHIAHTLDMPLPDACSNFEPYFVLDDARLKDVLKQFRKEMEGGLAEYGKDVAMVPSFVTGVPDGTEQG